MQLRNNREGKIKASKHTNLFIVAFNCSTEKLEWNGKTSDDQYILEKVIRQ